MYYLLDKNKSVDYIGVWANHLGEYTEIIGHTILGSIILYSPDTKEYLVLHPRMSGNNAKFYGDFDSIEEFENSILKHQYTTNIRHTLIGIIIQHAKSIAYIKK